MSVLLKRIIIPVLNTPTKKFDKKASSYIELWEDRIEFLFDGMLTTVNDNTGEEKVSHLYLENTMFRSDVRGLYLGSANDDSGLYYVEILTTVSVSTIAIPFGNVDDAKALYNMLYPLIYDKTNVAIWTKN